MEYMTFTTEGLSKIQIKFLAEVEKLYMMTFEADLDTLRMAIAKSGITPKDDIATPWSYWKAMHEIIHRRWRAFRQETVMDKWLKERDKDA